MGANVAVIAGTGRGRKRTSGRWDAPVLGTRIGVGANKRRPAFARPGTAGVICGTCIVVVAGREVVCALAVAIAAKIVGAGVVVVANLRSTGAESARALVELGAGVAVVASIGIRYILAISPRT